MDREKAVSLLHEILDALQNTVLFSQVSLGGSSEIAKNNVGYEIRMKCDFDKESWECVKPILKRDNLNMKVADDLVIIY